MLWRILMELFDQSTITFRQIKSSMEAPGPLTQLFPHFNEKFPWNLNWINVLGGKAINIFWKWRGRFWHFLSFFFYYKFRDRVDGEKKTFFQKRGTVSPLMYQIFLSNMHRHYCCFVRTYYVSLSAEENHKNSLNHRKTRNFFVCLSVFHFDVISA